MSDSFYTQRPSRSSFVDHYWHMTENHDGTYPLYMTVHWGFVFSKQGNQRHVQLIGPRTAPSSALYKKGEYFCGVVINAEVNLAGFTKRQLLNQVIALPVIDNNHFILAGHPIQIPEYDTFDDFIDGLIQQGLLFSAPIAAVSHRDTQRKVKRYTGLTPKQIEQAARVEQALTIIAQPQPLSSIAAEAGFADQAHMTRDFKRLVGLSPAGIRALFSPKE